ncbi:MAG: endonuclease III [Anaerolineales bacterium]|nr:endonuclease III [Anaerolineales bacterium]
MSAKASLKPPAPVPVTIARLRERHPDAHCELDYGNPLQLLVATILSAQCTDVRVNQVTPVLFARHPDAAALAGADRAELEEIVRSTGFYRRKAQHIQETAALILQRYGGEVPNEMDKLLTLPGVARKTANVVLGECFRIANGIVVDTHVRRLSQRLGWTTEQDPVKIENDLTTIIPKEDWLDISHLLIFHGRRICTARKPACPACPLHDICPASTT